MNNVEERIYLTTTPVKKLLLKFSIPCIIAMLVSALYNIVDQIFIGNSNAGVAGIMATTLVFPFTVISLALAQLIGDGCATLFSISLGKKDEETSNKSVANAIITVIILSLLLVLIGFIFKMPILNLLGINGYNEKCQKFTMIYYTIILCGVPFYMFSSAMSSVIRASGRPLYSMLSTIVGAIINLILDPIFIYGFNMGVKGAAFATIIGQIASAIFCCLYFRNPNLIKLTLKSFKIDYNVLRKTIKLGISSFITQISIAIITVVANNVVGIIGSNHATDAGGALGIVFKIFAIVLAFSLGVAVGGQPIIGFNYGAKKYKRVLETYKYILISNIVIGLIAMFMFEVVPSSIVDLFGGQANDIVFYRNYAILSFRIYLGGILLCCIQKASCIFLQSIDRPYKAMLLSLMRDVILLVPGVCILGLYGDLYKMLYAGLVADIGSFIVTLILVSMECRKIRKLVNEDNKEIINKLNNQKYVISIGREFGSGGKYIGECLAKRLNIKCYDNEILAKTASKYNIDINTLKAADEKEKNSFWYGFATNYYFSDKGGANPISKIDALFLKQAKVIEDIANKENCIIIGRCSDFILKNNNLIKIFIYSSDINFKVNRKKEFENISLKEALKKIEKTDKERANYYKHFTSQEWGDKENYDISIDSSVLGVERTIDILEKYINSRIENS